MKLLDSIRPWYTKYVTALENLQSVFLLLIRIIWGWGFFQTGKGKFLNFERTTEFFSSLGIPMPELNVVMAAGTEMVGGLLLLIGLGGRIVPVPLIFTMCIAYLTAHPAELGAIFSDSDKFFGAPPFLFLMAALIVLLFGPGKLSADYFFSKKR